MGFYKSLAFPLLKKMDAGTAYERTLELLQFAQGGLGRPNLQQSF